MRVVGAEDGAVFHENGGSDGALFLGMCVGGEGAGPGDVAVAGGVGMVAALGEVPAGASVDFAEREIVLGDVGIGAREAFFGNGKLVHEGEAEVVFAGGEIDFEEAVPELGGGLPADLAAEAGFIAGGLDGAEVMEEEEEESFEEVPRIRGWDTCRGRAE